MKIISDIRLYKSNIENIDGNSMPATCFACKKLNIILHRVVMKLRELGFSLGDFDYLYLNFTTCLPDGVSSPAKRSVDSYHPWFRYYDIGTSKELYADLGSEEKIAFILSSAENILLTYFSPDEKNEEIIKTAFTEALSKGSEMLMRFKEKKTEKATAIVYLRFFDDGYYHPLLCVYDLAGNEILNKALPRMLDLNPIGEIYLSSKRVSVKPRKNSFSKNLKPITFEF